MGKNIIRRSVVFNLENPLHKDLYDWCLSKTSNFSDFIRVVLFNYKNNEHMLKMINIKNNNYDKVIEKQEKHPLKKEDVSKSQGISIKVGGKTLSPINDKEAMVEFL